MRQPHHRSAEVRTKSLQCYLAATHAFIREWNEPCLCLPDEADPHFTNPGKTEGGIDVVGWLHT